MTTSPTQPSVGQGQDMLKLADRCEQATGPDRELDWLIVEVLGGVPEHTVVGHGTPHGWFRHPGEFTLWRTKESDPHAGVETWRPASYTASLDAAMTLVPEGWYWQVGQGDHAWAAAYENPVPPSTRVDPIAATPALALCAAALRARSA